MKARLKSGKIIQGRLAETFVSRNLAEQVKQGRPKKEEVKEPEQEIKEVVNKPKKEKK